jgi:hypothetical protein
MRDAPDYEQNFDTNASYLTQAGASVLEFIGLTVTFWRKTGKVYRLEYPRENEAKGGRTREALKSKITWICSLFFFTYMGVEGKHSHSTPVRNPLL